MSVDSKQTSVDFDSYLAGDVNLPELMELMLSEDFLNQGSENINKIKAKVKDNKIFFEESFANFMNLASRIAEILGQPFEDGDLVGAIKIVKSAKAVLKVNGVRIFADSHMDLETLQTMVAVLESYDPNSLELRRKEVSEG